MRITIITGCVSQKESVPQYERCARSLVPGSMEGLAAQWTRRIADTGSVSLEDLYRGRGFSEVKRVVTLTNASLWIVSAGLGLRRSTDASRPYSLTVVRGYEDSIESKVECGRFDGPEWWRLVNHGRSHPIADLINAHQSSLVLVALSGPYLDLVSEDLEKITSLKKQSVRLFTKSSLLAIPECINVTRMPYDGRLDGPDSCIPGTGNDFAQRALRHFVEKILPLSSKGNLEEHKELVLEFWEGKSFPSKCSRIRLEDADVVALILENWKVVSGSSSKMLRLLRDEKQVACEERRFRRLFKLARTQVEHR